MPKISFNFHGSFDNIDIERAVDTDTGKWTDVSQWSQEELLKGLKSGSLSLSLHECLMDGYDYLELTDFTCPLANITE